MTTTVTNTYRLHDERLLELARDIAKAQQKYEWKADTLRHVAGQNKRYRSRTQFVWVLSRTDFTTATVEDAVEKIERLVAEGDAYVPQYMGKPSRYLAEFIEAERELSDANVAYLTHEESYTGWQRYWLCLSNNGHVHHAYCSSFRPTTRVALVPSLSGASVGACVDVLGPALCSKCFPEAPVEWQDNAKIPGSVAEVLANQGEAAFHEALAAWRAKQAAKAAK